MGKNTGAPTMRAGVYQILNLKNGKRYVGSATQFGHRWWLHRRELNAKRHHSPIMQAAWDKYGADSFDFQIIEFVDDRRLLLAREQHYLDRMRPEYNISLTAGSRLGLKNSASHIAKLKATFATPESQAKLSARWKGKTQSEEHRAARAEGMKGNKNGAGYVVTPEQRAAMNAGRNAKIASGEIRPGESSSRPEVREKIGAALRGKKHSPERIERIREGRRRQLAEYEAEHGPTKATIEREQAVPRYSPKWVAKINAAKAENAAARTSEEAAEHSAKMAANALLTAETIRANKAAGKSYERTPEQRANYRKAALEAHARKRIDQEPELDFGT